MDNDTIFFFARNRVDKAVSLMLIRITRLYCKLTGRDNFSLFRQTLAVVVLYNAGCASIGIYLDPTLTAVLGLGMYLVLMHVIFWIAWRKVKRMREIARRILAGEPIDLYDVMLLHDVAGDRFHFFIFGALAQALLVFFHNTFPLPFGQCVFGVSLYFASHFTSGGTSAYARLKDTLRARAELKHLVPAVTKI